jgi:hypothetical protein
VRDAGVLANLSTLAVLACFYANPVGHALMPAAGARKRPAGDDDDRSDSRKKEAVKNPRQVNAAASPNDNDKEDEEDAQSEELVMVKNKAAAEHEDEEVMPAAGACKRPAGDNEDSRTPRPIAFSTCVSTLLPSETCAGRNVCQQKIGGLAAAPWRHLPSWFWRTTTRHGSARTRRRVKTIF